MSSLGGSSPESGSYVRDGDSPLHITVDDYALGKLIGLMLTMIEATVPVDNRTAAKSLTKQLIRTWFNDYAEGGKYYDLGNLGEEK